MWQIAFSRSIILEACCIHHIKSINVEGYVKQNLISTQENQSSESDLVGGEIPAVSARLKNLIKSCDLFMFWFEELFLRHYL